MEKSYTNGDGATLLQKKLNDPHTVDVLTRLLDRIDALENTVNRLADVVEQAPGFAAMVGDMVDEGYRSAAARGVNLEERMQNALTLAEKLTAPETTAQLEQLLALAEQAPGMAAMVGDMVDEGYRKAAQNGVNVEERLALALQMAEKLTAPETAAKLNQLLALADQAPGFMAMVGDMVDDTYRSAAAQGIDIEQRLMAGLAVAERLTAPQTVQNLNQLLDLAEQAPGFAAMVGDIMDETYRNALMSGIDIEQLIRRGAGAAGRIAEAANSDEFDALMNSGALAPDTLAVIGATGKALANASRKPAQRIGLLGLLSALRDPDTQKALGFLTSVGHELGKQL